ncbi:unnamed protein product, partial [Mesorhabditis belari]|uniref:Serpentine receptor class gamma n=1 Tax=Mesorhabditis belari TaxID=2138241 RepID=A0AAF3J3E7_9BILA
MYPTMFFVYLIYGTPTFILYLRAIYVICKQRKKFSSTFYTLYTNLLIVDFAYAFDSLAISSKVYIIIGGILNTLSFLKLLQRNANVAAGSRVHEVSLFVIGVCSFLVQGICALVVDKVVSNTIKPDPTLANVITALNGDCMAFTEVYIGIACNQQLRRAILGACIVHRPKRKLRHLATFGNYDRLCVAHYVVWNCDWQYGDELDRDKWSTASWNGILPLICISSEQASTAEPTCPACPKECPTEWFYTASLQTCYKVGPGDRDYQWSDGTPWYYPNWCLPMACGRGSGAFEVAIYGKNLNP